MRFILIFIVIVAILVAIVGVNSVKEPTTNNLQPTTNGSDTEEPRIYENNFLGFSIVLPQNVTIHPEGTNRMKFMYLGPEAIPNSEITDGFALIVSKEGVLGTQILTQHAQTRVEATRANMGTDISIVEPTEVNGRNAYRYSYTNLLGTRSTDYILASTSGQVYLASYTVVDPNNLGYETQVRMMIESLTLK